MTWDALDAAYIDQLESQLNDARKHVELGVEELVGARYLLRETQRVLNLHAPADGWAKALNLLAEFIHEGEWNAEAVRAQGRACLAEREGIDSDLGWPGCGCQAAEPAPGRCWCRSPGMREPQ